MSAQVDLGIGAAALCAALDVEVPVIQAPMAGGWTTPRLVAAVSRAGGLGMLAAARLTLDELERQIAEVRAATDRPFGVNFLLAPPEPTPSTDRILRAARALDLLREEVGLPATRPPGELPPSPLAAQFDLVVRERVPVVSFAMGAPDSLAARARSAGATVLATATTPEEAVRLEGEGVHAVVAQGAEAGGHRSTFRVRPDEPLPLLGLVVLVPAVREAVEVPVIASGGVMDGRGLAAALALGASGVQMGTRFLTAAESGAFQGYREWLTRRTGLETEVTWSVTGRPARAFRNRIVEAADRVPSGPLPWPYQALVAGDLYEHGLRENDPELAPLLAGQGVGMGDDAETAGEIVRAVAHDAKRIIGELSGG